MTKVVLPPLGEGIDKATITYWFVEEGASVKEGENLVELATEKSTFNLPSPVSGTLTQRLHEEGDAVYVGDVIAIID